MHLLKQSAKNWAETALLSQKKYENTQLHAKQVLWEVPTIIVNIVGLVVKLGYATSVLHVNSDTIVVIATNAIPFVLNTNLSHVQNYLSLLMSVTTAQTIISDAP